MDETLKRLLDAELEAEKLVDKANRERDELVELAREEARNAEQRFEARIPELRYSFQSKAESRAKQTIEELSRRYQERHQQLIAMASEGREESIEAALSLLVRTEQS